MRGSVRPRQDYGAASLSWLPEAIESATGQKAHPLGRLSVLGIPVVAIASFAVDHPLRRSICRIDVGNICEVALQTELWFEQSDDS
jgi:hypothetical protein